MTWIRHCKINAPYDLCTQSHCYRQQT